MESHQINNIKQININNVKKVDYDQLLTSAGVFGTYQIFLLLISFPFYVFGVFSYLIQIFLTEIPPNHWCWIPELANLTDIDRRNLAIPPDPGARFGYSHCQAYVANWTEVLYSGQGPEKTWPIAPCQHGWEFNRTEIPYPTISSEQEWVCEKSSYQATAQCVYFVGSIVGGFIFGWIADRYGRLAAAVGSNLIGCVAGIVTVYARNFLEFTWYRFLAGMAYDNCMMMVYLLVLEYVAPKYRTMIGNISSGIIYTLAMTSLPWIALACNDWRILGLITSAPMALALFAPMVIPESPRWLLGKGRINEAVQKVLTVARINKTKIPTEIVDNFKASISLKDEQESTSILEVFRRPLLRKVFICMCLNYMCCTSVFDGLVRSVGILPFDFFVSFSITSFTELPSLFLVAFLMDLTGRKWLTIVCMVLCCITSILTSFTASYAYVSLTCAFVARFAINMSYYIAIQWTAEILPTSVRGSGFSIVHICGYVATIVSPYIVYLETFVPGLPLIIIGVLAAVGAASTFAIPDTSIRSMPHSFEEADDIIRNQKLFDIPCLQKKITDYKGEVNNCFELH